MSRIWGVALVVLASATAGAESRPAGGVAEQVGRSVEAWNRQHRGAFSMRYAADQELSSLLYQWDETLPDCRECQITDIRVTEVDGEAEVRWTLAGEVSASGVTRLSVSNQQSARR